MDKCRLCKKKPATKEYNHINFGGDYCGHCYRIIRYRKFKADFESNSTFIIVGIGVITLFFVILSFIRL